MIGHFGSEDDVGIPAASDEIVSELDLLVGDRLGHGIGYALSDIEKLNLGPSEVAVDLMVLAAHIHAADTRLARSTESQDGWSREIRLVVPVSDPKLWTRSASIVKRALDFLTGDRWQIGFRARPEAQATLAKPRPKPLLPVAFDAINLFSGGLDSLIGAIDALEAGGAPLLVSHAGEGAVSKSQEECFEVLKTAYPDAAFDRLRIWMTFGDGLIDGVESESTTRGRSFLFFSLGVAAGTGLGKEFVLRVPENGLIALNVPLDRLRLGALSTRTTHPFYMARWNELLEALGIDGQLVNPYWDKTKGEMVTACANPGVLNDAVEHSLSCSSPAKGRWKKEAQGHCGYCLPCLIRRASLAGNDPTTYRVPDLTAHTLDTRQAEGQQVRSFQLAISRLARRPELARVLIHKPGSLSDNPDRINAYADVYRRGLEEVGAILAGVKTAPS
ncbi:Qat anti-phage system QueC-like protein QatC [Ruegeria sp. HKCCD8929]|uniref:Qat anti-phage system QueC-like protein QatC n=1 Tax=Ruegeria sp. HKCCD8929 TaxID=2683006 RepID=UPI0020C57DD4|nr:Qat anti-phage system QueC-like protein QatC [Ruegeria sp. HKCCD8929]